MVFTDLPLTQEFKTLGMDDYLWVQALFNHEELERLRGQEPNDPHQQFLWRIIRMGVSGPLYPKLSMCFEGTRLTQLVQLATAGRLFLGHKGQVDL